MLFSELGQPWHLIRGSRRLLLSRGVTFSFHPDFRKPLLPCMNRSAKNTKSTCPGLSYKAHDKCFKTYLILSHGFTTLWIGLSDDKLLQKGHYLPIPKKTLLRNIIARYRYFYHTGWSLSNPHLNSTAMRPKAVSASRFGCNDDGQG